MSNLYIFPTLHDDVMFSESALLADPANLDLALQEVRTVLEQAIRMVKTNQHKTGKFPHFTNN